VTVAQQVSREHHYVPKFLLEPWLQNDARGQSLLTGFFWDARRNALAWKTRGLKGFCWQLDLLILKGHNVSPDALEKRFFGHVDRLGAAARKLLLSGGVNALNGQQRCDFARLLLSLEARHPKNVARLRLEVAAWRTAIDQDPELRQLADEMGVRESISEYSEKTLRVSIEDRLMLVIQRLVDNAQIGPWLVNASWALRHLPADAGRLVLADRPLVRIHGATTPGATWALPLTPSTVFIACNHASNLESLMTVSSRRFLRRMNESSASQADRYVFSTDAADERWLKKRLKPSDVVATTTPAATG
jgi:hypothetical protein